jgi:hypothetical protein
MACLATSIIRDRALLDNLAGWPTDDLLESQLSQELDACGIPGFVIMRYRDDDGKSMSAAFIKQDPSSECYTRVLHVGCDGFLLQRQASVTVTDDHDQPLSLPLCRGKHGHKLSVVTSFRGERYIGDSYAGDSVMTLWKTE